MKTQYAQDGNITLFDDDGKVQAIIDVRQLIENHDCRGINWLIEIAFEHGRQAGKSEVYSLLRRKGGNR